MRILALDIAKRSDFAVLAELRASGTTPRKYGVVALDRWRGEKYQVTVARLLKAARRHPDAVIALDGTGVGQAVVDLVRDGLPRRKIYAVTSTAGKRVNAGQEPGDVNVPKTDLIACVKVLLQSGRLLFSPDLPLLRELQSEFVKYEERRTEKLNITYEGASGSHDDIVSAVALGCWIGEQAPQPLTDERVARLVLNCGPDEAEPNRPRSRLEELAADHPALFGAD